MTNAGRLNQRVAAAKQRERSPRVRERGRPWHQNTPAGLYIHDRALTPLPLRCDLYQANRMPAKAHAWRYRRLFPR